MGNILVANNITKKFGGLVAINDLSINIKQGSISSIIGPNGAGKTTFFNCVTGFYDVDMGEIEFDGDTIQNRRPDQITKIGIARTYQNIRLFDSMTSIENILVGQETELKSAWYEAIWQSKRLREEEEGAIKRARELLSFIGLTGTGDLLARNLPYGQQRRLEIARALASNPKLLLLDEPTAGMNPNETGEMTAFIRRLRDELDITILLIEHDMRVVMGISEQITVLDYGSKIAEGKPKKIQKDPKVIEAYLGRGAAAGLEKSKAS